MNNTLNVIAHDFVPEALMQFSNKKLRQFIRDELIKMPRQRNKAEYASAIADHFNRSEICIALERGRLRVDVCHWHK